MFLRTCILREQDCPGLYGRFLQSQQRVSPWGTQQPANCSAALCCWASSYCVGSWCPLWLPVACLDTLNTSLEDPSATDRENRVKHNHGSCTIIFCLIFFTELSWLYEILLMCQKMAIKGVTAVRSGQGTPLFWAVTGFPVKCSGAEWVPHSLWLAAAKKKDS